MKDSFQRDPRDLTDASMIKALEETGQRLTRQKLEVFHFMQKHGVDHPTAEEVYFGVKKAVSSISLATVYNCLESLVGCKVLNRLNIAGTPSHYEMRGPQHHHFRCVACGKIFDFEARLPVTRLAEETGFRVTDCQLQLSGYCPACQQKENQTL